MATEFDELRSLIVGLEVQAGQERAELVGRERPDVVGHPLVRVVQRRDADQERIVEHERRRAALLHGRHGRRVRVAGAVITRQRPGTAKGFVFLTLEDETGIANVIVRPDLFSEQKRAIVAEPYLLVEGTLQIQEGVTSIKAERVIGLSNSGPQPQSHDFR